jgi:demethylmenaquinone methyltransferase/2-methoxy-6-polyprenyl-1,4-benzoquinol methylase
MFTRIAHRYDLMNQVMTMGQDKYWRREVIRRAALPAGGRLLDLGAGTGDLAIEALHQNPTCRAVAADFTLGMMKVGRARISKDNFGRVSFAHSYPLEWSAADACQLPFPDQTFDALVSGFLLRNVIDVAQSLQEQFRVLKPGGMVVALDTTPPPKTPFTPLIHLHLHTIIPALGRFLTGQADAYTYLPDSTEGFLAAERLAARLVWAGFQEVGFRRLMFGTIAIHWGRKPKHPRTKR